MGAGHCNVPLGGNITERRSGIAKCKGAMIQVIVGLAGVGVDAPVLMLVLCTVLERLL
jgi:hypothetical protein